MPQPRSSSGRSSRSGATTRKSSTSSTRKPAASSAKKPAASKPRRKTAAASRTASPRKAAASPRKTSASSRKPSARRGSASTARKAATSARRGARSGGEDTLATLNSLRDHLTRGLVLTGERLQETMDDTVRRGRITRDDAEELIQSLVSIGRKQTEDILTDLEKLVGRRPTGAAAAARDAGKRARGRVEATAARARKSEPADRVLREVDRARRAARVGPSFPVMGYDDLSAAQISSRLSSLTAAQLRKVRDYERRHANRKSVLSALAKKLPS
jgi:polyhydroxyalkanoate synthesis regulator phasin